MPLSVATGIGGTGSRDLRVAMMLNNNGQAITLAKDFAGAGYGDLDGGRRRRCEAEGAPTLAMTFPGGTHDMWLRYWLQGRRRRRSTRSRSSRSRRRRWCRT